MPLRSEPAHQAEQISQLIFGEKAEILEINNNDWAHIRCAWDDYEGWCNFSQLTLLNKKEYASHTKYICGSHRDKLIFENSEMQLPFCSELIGYKKNKVSPIKDAGIYKGKKVKRDLNTLSSEFVKRTALQFLNAPYQWGGRSLAGIDCSGFTQIVYKYCNYRLPRDASQQAVKGNLVDFLENGRCGDLAFFDNKDGKIIHVGILLDNKTIIHAASATGRVMTDLIDQGGIISTNLKKRTHQLRFVKRFIKE